MELDKEELEATRTNRTKVKYYRPKICDSCERLSNPYFMPYADKCLPHFLLEIRDKQMILIYKDETEREYIGYRPIEYCPFCGRKLV